MWRTARCLGRRGCARSAHSQGCYTSADTDVNGGKEFAGFLVPWREADVRTSPESAVAALTEADALRSMDHFFVEDEHEMVHVGTLTVSFGVRV